MKRKLCIALMLVMMLLMLVPFETLAQEIVDSNITDICFQGDQNGRRVSFYDSTNERRWVFFAVGDTLYYRTSLDSTIWTARVSTGVTLQTYYGYLQDNWDIAYDGINIHIVANQGSTTVSYRKGIPNANGLGITWAANLQTVVTGVVDIRSNARIAIDSNGYPWVTCLSYDNSEGQMYAPYAYRSSKKDGNWTSSDVVQKLSTTSEYWVTMPIALTNGKMAMIYGASGGTIRTQRWTGSGWGSEAHSVSSLAGSQFPVSGTGQDDNVHLVFLKKTSYDIVYTQYSYSTNTFSAETAIYSAATSSSYPVMTMDSANNLHVFWENDPTDDHMYYAMYNYDESTWYSYYDLVDEIDDLPATGYYLNSDYTCDRENLGVYYIAGTTILKFKLVDEPFVVDTLAPTPLGNTYATLRGEIISLGFGSATERGFLFNTSPTDIGAILEGNETGTFNVGVFTHGITGLLAAHTYWYVAYASGDYGTSWGNWTSFYTSAPVPTPPSGNITGDSATICSTTAWNFLAVPITNTDIKLTWDWWPVGGNSTVQIAIYYGLYYYPIDLADGTLIYQGTGDAYTHTNLSPGTTYYYRAWLLCGGNYSADYVQDWATTYGSSPVVSPPEQPEGWFLDPSCTAYSKIPMLSDALVAVTTAYGFPATTVCVMFTLLWIIVLGLAVFLFIHSAMIMIITIAVLIILASIMGLLPLWMIVIAICLGGISIYISSRT